MRETIKEYIFHMLYNDGKQEDLLNGNFASNKLCQHQDLNPQPSYPAFFIYTLVTGLGPI